MLWPLIGHCTYIPPIPMIAAKFPAVNGAVHAIAVAPAESKAGILYIGGSFTQVGGQSRNNAAAFNLWTGELTDWNPDVNGPVHAILAIDGTVYLGGAFTQVGGQSRSNLAAVDATSSATFSWKPDPDGTVETLACTADTVFVGGAFQTVAALARGRLAAFSRSSRAWLAWNPGADAAVHVLALRDSTLYTGGDFQTIAGSSRPFAAALDAGTSSPLPWNPQPNGAVRTYAFRDSTVFMGGDFTEVGGVSHPYVAATDGTNGNVATWNPVLDGTVRALATFQHILHIGGDFTHVGGTARSHFATVDDTTGQLFSWAPASAAAIHSLQLTYSIPNTNRVDAAALLIGSAESPGLTREIDPLWDAPPAAVLTKIDGKPWRKIAPRAYRMVYETSRSHVVIKGLAMAGGDLPDVIKLAFTGRTSRPLNMDALVTKVMAQIGRKQITTHGANHWRITLPAKGFVRFIAFDSLGRRSYPRFKNGDLSMAGLSMLRLKRMTSPPNTSPSSAGSRKIAR